MLAKTDPALLVSGFSLPRIFFCSFSGKPPRGIPISPLKNSTTEDGKDISLFGSKTSAGVRSLVIIYNAISPTTFDDGVTLIISPNIVLTSAYIFATSPHLSVVIPRERACSLRFVNCPPGIWCKYTSELPPLKSVSKAL